MKNHYDVLELDKNCTSDEIRDSYIALSKKYHPDKNKSDEAQKKILEVNEAYSVLKNKFSRCRYDESLKLSKAGENINQTGESFYRTRPQTYDEFVQYYQRRRGEDFSHSRLFPKPFTIVLCCCMLMVFGSGIRIMYACSEAKRRRIRQQEANRHALEIFEAKKKIRQLLREKELAKEREQKKSES